MSVPPGQTVVSENTIVFKSSRVHNGRARVQRLIWLKSKRCGLPHRDRVLNIGRTKATFHCDNPLRVRESSLLQRRRLSSEQSGTSFFELGLRSPRDSAFLTIGHLRVSAGRISWRPGVAQSLPDIMPPLHALL